MSHGGARKGAGKTKGTLAEHTKLKLEARKLMETRILKRLNPLLNAQMVLAQGVSYVYKIVTTGEGKTLRRETVLVKDPDEIRDFLDEHEGSSGTLEEGGDYYFITTEKPDNKAIDSMMDRVFGKATQAVEFDNPQQNEQLAEMNTKLESMFHNVKAKRKNK